MKAPDEIFVSSEMDGYWTNLQHNNTDVHYIRADIVDTLRERVKRLSKRLHEEGLMDD